MERNNWQLALACHQGGEAKEKSALLRVELDRIYMIKESRWQGVIVALITKRVGFACHGFIVKKNPVNLVNPVEKSLAWVPYASHS